MADSDTGILFGIIIFFVLLGAVLPFINEFNPQGSPFSETNLTTGFNGEDLAPADYNVITAVVKISGSIISMFFWTFGAIPFYIDLIIFIPIRFLLWYLVVRLIRGV